MTPYRMPSRRQRKWRKFRREPVRFFADAKSPLVRRVGLWALVAAHIMGDGSGALARLVDRLRMAGRQRRFTLEPMCDLRPDGDAWESTGYDPQFRVTAHPAIPHGGWALIHLEIAEQDDWLEPVLYVDDGRGFREQMAIRLLATTGGTTTRMVKLPRRTKALRLDPMARTGRFHIDSFKIEMLTSWAALRHALAETDNVLPAALSRCRAHNRQNTGHTGISRDEYAQWIKINDTLSDEDRTAIRRRIGRMVSRPKFSIIMPVYNTHLPWLEEALDSVAAQLYPDWELCIVDDASTDPEIPALLKRRAATDERIKHCRRTANGGIVAASNDALAMATGAWVVTVDHDDRLSEHAFYYLATAINARPNAAIIYSDHDHLTPRGERDNPYFKPDWNYELCLGQNLVNHLSAFRRDDVMKLGGFRKGFDGSQDWDLLLRLIETVPAEAILHIPRVLYHWRVSGDGFSQSQAGRAWNSGQRAVEEHLARTGQDATVHAGATSAGHLAVRWALPENPPLVSVVIPTRDRVNLLGQCMNGVVHRTDYPNLEVLIVDNGSVEPETHAYYQTLANDPCIRILKEPGEFNFSRLCNRGVAAARGEIYVLLNNDIDVINPDWLSEMVSHALRPGVGAVGAKLYYPDGTIQHGGVILGIGGVAGHAHTLLPANADGYQGRARLAQRMSAVTAACVVGKKEVYDNINGLNEKNLKVAFNDVDFCLRLGETGYAVIWTPFAELYHHESASRGKDVASNGAQRFERETKYMKRKWAKRIRCDPAYNPNFSLSGHVPCYTINKLPRLRNSG